MHDTRPEKFDNGPRKPVHATRYNYKKKPAAQEMTQFHVPVKIKNKIAGNDDRENFSEASWPSISIEFLDQIRFWR